jgi:beta-lactamase superfamily II metal-dependent hydrolase
LPEIADCRRVDDAFLHEQSFLPSESTVTTALLTRHFAARHINVKHLPATIAAGSAGIRALWPAAPAALTQPLGENDRSLVSTIEFANRSILLCSDIEKPAQGEILHLYPEVRADVVVVPHHGSVRTLDAAFLPQLAAGTLVCSCGRRDCEQGRVLRQANHAEVFLTATVGAVIVCIDRTGVVRTSTFRSQPGD